MAREAAIEFDFEMDGEHVGDFFHVFDLLSIKGEDLRGRSFQHRYGMLEKLMEDSQGKAPFMRILECNTSEATKRAHLDWVKATRREGIVFKRLAAPYETGRSQASMKYKLVDSSTCVVIAKNNQRSVQIGMHDGVDGPLIPMGNVTIPVNKAIPEPGDLIEVEYLYFNLGGALEQPVYLCPRADVTREAAVLAQIIRFKPDADEVAAPTERQRG